MSDDIENAVDGDEQAAGYLTALLTVIGFALYWATVCTLLFSGAFATTGVSPIDGYLLRAFFLVGFCIMQLLSSTALPDALAGDLASLTLVGCLGAVFVLVVVLSVVPYASNRAVEDLFAHADTGKAPALPAEPRPDPWEAACETICDERGLTPREREVFAYLARGRNADHIAGELVISVHTAKTHTARIYRKLGINSQQQLIDIVEHAAS